MSSNLCYLPTWLTWTDPVTVTPVLGAWRTFGPEPPRSDEGSATILPRRRVPLTFWVDRHPIASRWYEYGAYEAIKKSHFFSGPVTVFSMAEFPRRTDGWMCMVLAAVGATNPQANELLRIHQAPLKAPIVHTTGGRFGLALGHHWIGVPVDVKRHLSNDGALTRSYVAEFCSQVSRLIVHGSDEERATRFLESVPGIRGERPDPVCSGD